jgi:hypothetical protein
LSSNFLLSWYRISLAYTTASEEELGGFDAFKTILFFGEEELKLVCEPRVTPWAKDPVRFCFLGVLFSGVIGPSFSHINDTKLYTSVSHAGSRCKGRE